MKRYRAVEDLYERREFYGISEEAHVHALSQHVAVSVFNIDERARTIEGSIRLAELGLGGRQTGRRGGPSPLGR